MDKEIWVYCKKHGIKYNVFDTHCPMCEQDRSALEYMKKWLTCQLCGEIKASTQIYCGGPVGLMCDDCAKLLRKYGELKDRFEEIHRKRRNEIDAQIFFRKTFDNDPVEVIWG